MPTHHVVAAVLLVVGVGCFALASDNDGEAALSALSGALGAGAVVAFVG